MIWNRVSSVGLLMLACSATGCGEGVGPCESSLGGRDTVVVNNTVVYGGQAIMNQACATGCHSSKATGRARRGVPAGLDFDLLPVDEEDAAGTKKSGKRTIVKLKSAQVEGLRARQKKIVELRDLIWQQVQDGLMPPGGMFTSVMSSIFASSESKPCEAGKPYSTIQPARTREVLRSWLACGAPLVETNGKEVEKSAVPGAAGYQYPACVQEPDAVVTLESLFKTTFSECGGCHNNALTGPPSFRSVEVLAEALREESRCAEKPFVTPGTPEESYLLDLLKGPNVDCNHERMPKGGLDPLSDRAIAEVSAWIAAGAPTTSANVDERSDERDTSESGDDPQSDDSDARDGAQNDDSDARDDSDTREDAESNDARSDQSDAGDDSDIDA